MYESFIRSKKENQINPSQNQSSMPIMKKTNPTYPLSLSTDVRICCSPQKNSGFIPSHTLQPQIIQKRDKDQSCNIIQLYTANDTTYDGEEIEWTNEDEKNRFWTTVDAGFTNAQQHLNSTIQAWQNEGNPDAPLAKYAQAVLNVLENDNLLIYPMCIPGTYGLSGYNEYAISININLLNGKVEQMAKTLIHEAFHIIGGCWTVDPVTNVHTQKEETRSISKSIPYLYNQLNEKKLEDMNADTFAQYVMQW